MSITPLTRSEVVVRQVVEAQNKSLDSAGSTTNNRPIQTGDSVTISDDAKTANDEKQMALNPAPALPSPGLGLKPNPIDDPKERARQRALHEIVAKASTPDFSATTQQGTTVSTATTQNSSYAPVNFTRDGVGSVSVDVSAGHDLHIKESENGISVFNKTTGKATLMTFDGKSQDMEDLSTFADKSGNDIIVNFTQSEVDAGDGNDIILNYANNAKIIGGNGNDTLMMTGKVSGVTADLGDGDDTLLADKMDNSSVSLGNGNDRVDMRLAQNSTIDAGEGNNSLRVTAADNNTSVRAGNGNNSIDSKAFQYGSSIHFGNGNNNVSVDYLNINSEIRVGNGANRVLAGAVENHSSISIEMEIIL